jgi:hypothetical protein
MEYIKQLGSYCEEHLKLFDISSHELIPK